MGVVGSTVVVSFEIVVVSFEIVVVSFEGGASVENPSCAQRSAKYQTSKHKLHVSQKFCETVCRKTMNSVIILILALINYCIISLRK